MSGTAKLIGGQPIQSWGSWISVGSIGDDGRIDQSFAGGAGGIIIDCSYWRLQQFWHEKPLYCSGLLGHPSSRRFGYFHQWEAVVTWDAGNPPEWLFHKQTATKLPVSMMFCMGVVLGNQDSGAPTGDQAPDVSVTQRHWKIYYSPLATLTSAIPHPNAKDLKFITMTLSGSGKGHFFMLPDEVKKMNATIAYYNRDDTRGLVIA